MLTGGRQRFAVHTVPDPGVRRVATGAGAREAWERVAAGPHLAVTQLPAWMDCMAAASGYLDATRLYETSDERLLVLPLARRGAVSSMALYGSWPMYWEGGLDNGGLLSSDDAVTAADVRGVVEDLRRSPGLRTTVVPSVSDARAWVEGVPAGVDRCAATMYSVDLTGGFDAAWGRRVSKTERYKARKAERLGVEIESDDTGRLLPVFDRLYETSMRAWAQESALPSSVAGSLLRRRFPHATLEQVASRLGSTCRVWIAWKGGEPLSGLVVLSHGPAATLFKGATDKERVRTLPASTLLHRSVIEAASAEGRTRYELSGSGQESLTRFKLNLGARPVESFMYRFERMPVTATERSMRGGLRRVITRPLAAGSG
jgi:hypothetical protein